MNLTNIKMIRVKELHTDNDRGNTLEESVNTFLEENSIMSTNLIDIKYIVHPINELNSKFRKRVLIVYEPSNWVQDEYDKLKKQEENG
jgi:hypothetical protein